MTALSPNARRELDALARVEGPRKAEAILISHQRRDVGSCLCGWAELGKSHAGHQVAKLREAGLLAAEGPGSPCSSVLADRERELLDLKGPCSNRQCRLHLAHSGPCDTRPAR